MLTAFCCTSEGIYNNIAIYNVHSVSKLDLRQADRLTTDPQEISFSFQRLSVPSTDQRSSCHSHIPSFWVRVM